MEVNIFYSPGLDDATLVAVSSTVTFKNYNQPLQGHLALTDDPTEMVYVQCSVIIS